MDENKIPEQEDSWLDDVLGPESAGAELGPDESALFNEHLIDPGAPAAESPEIPEALPDDFQPQMSLEGMERTVCDYIAGMTDKYAVDKFTELFTPMGWRVRG